MGIVSSTCVCVFFPFILDVKFVGCTSRGHTGEEGYTRFLIHLPSAVYAFIFLARRVHSAVLSLVDREVDFCALTIESFSTSWAYMSFVGERLSIKGRILFY